MATEIRFLYDNPDPSPASDWFPAEHGMTVDVRQPLIGIQVRDTEKSLTGDDVPAKTLLINQVVEAITDADGFLLGAKIDPEVRQAVNAVRNGADPDQAIAEALGIDLSVLLGL